MTAVASPHSRSSFDSFASSNPARRQYNRLKKDSSRIVESWTDSKGELPQPLDKRFVEVKKRLVTPDKYAAVQASWDRLLLALQKRAVEIQADGPSV